VIAGAAGPSSGSIHSNLRVGVPVPLAALLNPRLSFNIVG
jgi:hypothetical protein